VRVSVAIPALNEEHHIESVANPDNARSPLFCLSKHGKEVLNAITRAADPWLRHVSEELSLEDLRRGRTGGNRPLRRAPATLLDVQVLVLRCIPICASAAWIRYSPRLGSVISTFFQEPLDVGH
jgi:hypothetical protein